MGYLIDANTAEVEPFLTEIATNHVVLISGLAQAVETHSFLERVLLVNLGLLNMLAWI